MSRSKSRIAVIGAGVMGANHARAIAQGLNTQLAGIIDFDKHKATETASRFGVEVFESVEQLTDKGLVDGVVIAATTNSHATIASNLIHQRVPILIEKPITDDIESTREILSLAHKTGVPVMCGFVERFNPAIRTAMSMLDEPIKHFMSVRHSPANPRTTASVVYDLLIHDIDAALAFNGRGHNVANVMSVNWKPSGSDVDEIADCVIKFDNQSIASLSASRQGQRKIRELRVVTDNRLFDIDLLRVNVTVYRNVMQEVVENSGTTAYRAETIIDMPFIRHEGEPLALQMRHFDQLIRGEIDFQEELNSLLRPHEIADLAIRNSD